MSQRDLLTFGLAFAGYCLLAAAVVALAAGQPAPWLRRGLALVVSLHVVLVWHWRFEWSLEAALRKSAAGFVLFHGALTAIVAAAFVAGRAAPRLLATAFVVVSAAAVPAPWRYPEIAALRVPMIVVCVAALFAWPLARQRRGVRGP